MVSLQDTATFFHQGTASQFQYVLNLYPQVLRLKAESKTKPDDLIELDTWYQNELPKIIQSRGKDAFCSPEELVKIEKWQEARDHYSGSNHLMIVNNPSDITNETNKAFQKLPNLEQAVSTLFHHLKVINTTTASALLAAAAPDIAPYFATTCLRAIPEMEHIDYTVEGYLEFVRYLQNTANRLNLESNEPYGLHSIELALWTHFVASKLKPELLNGIPCADSSSAMGISLKNGDVSITASNSFKVDVCVAPSEKSLLRFTPLTSFVNNNFWFKFTDLKLNHDMLNEVTRHIWGYYSYNDRSGSLLVDYTSFNREYDNCPSRSVAHGYHINTNTIEKFKDLDKSDLLQKYGLQLLDNMKSGEAVKDPSKLVIFLLLTFSDLKKYHFTYWFAFPAILDSSYYVCDTPKSLETYVSPDQVRTLSEYHKKLPENQKGFFCFSLQNSEVVLKSIEEFVGDKENVLDNVYIAFLDPTSLEHIPGWPLRNLLSLLKIQVYGIREKTLKIVSIRGESSNWHSRSVVFTIRYSEQSGDAPNENKIVGWEKNSKGKLSPRMVNLATDMDPAKLSSRAVDLNLKLVKWRLQPDLDLSVIKGTSCLLLGAGTLGCSVARGLLAWGVEKITFVDSGFVSYSNPARQSLYTFSDCRKSASKASSAASALKLIHPGVEATGEVIRISMPGHSEYDMNDVHKLTELVKSHDVTFLLTDSRESRWLPTILCSVFQKIAITIALGYESYVILRHGVRSDGTETKLGCYFCNDVVAPGNSQTDRTLDQQCTVTRPGVSNIAASIGVELLVSLLQHSKKGLADGSDTSCLGKIPHSIRGFIADFENMLLCTPAFNQCIACSPIVIKEYLQDSDGFLQKVFSDVKYLPNLTALSQYELIDDELEFPEMSDEDSS